MSQGRSEEDPANNSGRTSGCHVKELLPTTPKARAAKEASNSRLTNLQVALAISSETQTV